MGNFERPKIKTMTTNTQHEGRQMSNIQIYATDSNPAAASLAIVPVIAESLDTALEIGFAAADICWIDHDKDGDMYMDHDGNVAAESHWLQEDANAHEYITRVVWRGPKATGLAGEKIGRWVRAE